MEKDYPLSLKAIIVIFYIVTIYKKWENVHVPHVRDATIFITADKL